MKKILVLIAATCQLGAVLAGSPQIMDSLVHKGMFSYSGTFGMGAMVGCQDCKVTGTMVNISISTVHGVRIGKKASVGLGIGFDAYESWKTVPFFGRASWDLFGKRNKVFFQFDYGYSAGYATKESMYLGTMQSKGGKTIGAALGYKVAISKVNIQFTAGYKFQRVNKHYDYPAYPWMDIAPSPTNFRDVRQDMERFVVGMTFGW